jgi:uncharacterized protein (DUF736 family)
MSVIGTLTPAKDGSRNDSIHTMTINTKVRLVPNDNRENPRVYLCVKLDDASLPEVILAALFEAADGALNSVMT